MLHSGSPGKRCIHGFGVVSFYAVEKPGLVVNKTDMGFFGVRYSALLCKLPYTLPTKLAQ